MKITLDLTDLVAKGQLTPDEARRLQGLAAQDTGALGVNILMAFGTVAICLGIAAVLPHPFTAIGLGALLFGTGLTLKLSQEGRWNVFAQLIMVIGAIALTGGISFYSDGSLAVNLALTMALGAAAVVARSGLLAALAVLGLTLTVGSSLSGWTGGFDAPIVITIGVLAVLTLVLYIVSLRVPGVYERIALIAARTAILMINFAFLYGSIFGDGLLDISSQVIAIAWAVSLVGSGLWAIRANRRWVVNSAAIFGAIHFFVQWFMAFGADPFTVLGAGLLLIVFGFALRWFNQRFIPKGTAPASGVTQSAPKGVA